MFQLFAGKQVFNVAQVLNNLSKQKDPSHLGNICPSCTTHRETCEHILSWNEEGRTKNMSLQIRRISCWLQEVGTNPTLNQMITNSSSCAALWCTGEESSSQNPHTQLSSIHRDSSDGKELWRGWSQKDSMTLTRQRSLNPQYILRRVATRPNHPFIGSNTWPMDLPQSNDSWLYITTHLNLWEGTAVAGNWNPNR